MAQSFNWGVDLPMGGFGITAVRHINGSFVDARQFLDGNDSEAIQAAADFIAALSEASGVIFLPPRASPYAIDTTVTLSGSNITITGAPNRTKMSLDTAAVMFSILGNNVTIQNLQVDGNNTSTDLIRAGAATRHITINNVVVGMEDVGRRLDGYLFSSVFDVDDLRITNCKVWGGGGLLFLNATLCERIEVYDNECDMEFSSGTAGRTMISIEDCAAVQIKRNRIQGINGSTRISRALLITDCDECQITDNNFNGSDESLVKIKDSDKCVFRGNTFLNGGEATTAGDDGTMFLDNCDDTLIDGNLISSTTHTGVYSIIIGDGSTYGAAACLDTVLTNNLFSNFTLMATPAGNYRPSNTDVIFDVVLNFTTRSGNTTFRDQILTYALTGSSNTTEAITVKGLKATSGMWKAISVTMEDGNAIGIRIHAIADDTLTVGLSAAGDIPTSVIHIVVHA